MSNGFVLHIHYNNAPPMTSNSNFNVCVLVGNVNSILPYILQIELEYFGPFVTSFNGNVLLLLLDYKPLRVTMVIKKSCTRTMKKGFYVMKPS